MEREPYTEETLRLVEDLIAYLRRDSVAVRLYDGDARFLHAKCYIVHSDPPGQQYLFDRFQPVAAIVGSSNFTAAGLCSNRELNVTHKVLLDPEEADDPEAADSVNWLSQERPSETIIQKNRQLLKSEVGARAIIELDEWYSRQWDESQDFCEDLIELLDASKFGAREYTPYEVYMKALYEYFRVDMENQKPSTEVRSAVDLAEFQESAVKKARRILSRYDGVMIADSVGLGKTWIGKKLLEDYAYHLRQKAVVICPAALRQMWEQELTEATISGRVISQEVLGRDEFDPSDFADADVVLIDESHNFRNHNSKRYLALDALLGRNNRRGSQGLRKKVILLTATPINNDLLDLYHQINLVTGGDKSYFASAGIGDVYRYFLRARKARGTGGATAALFNLLEEMVIRRTRAFIKRAYPDATIRGKAIAFPDRTLHSERYNLEETYQGLYEEIVRAIGGLRLAPYDLESYKKDNTKVNKMEQGRQMALVGIFKSRFLKRLESSIEAFRISVRRALEFQTTFLSYLLDGKLLVSKDFHKMLRLLVQDEEDEASAKPPKSLAAAIDESEEASGLVEELEEVDTADYTLRKVQEAVQEDVDALTDIWHKIKGIGPEQDAKLDHLKGLLKELKGQKVLVFSYYKDTVRYLAKELAGKGKRAVAFRGECGNVRINRMDSDRGAKDRVRIVRRFAPVASGKPELAGTDREIDVLISTDVLSEGQNLQDCAQLINYDLHWNPTRMVQRAGRIDRIGTPFDLLHVHNMFPDEGLERLLNLVRSLERKISDIDRTGFLDASVLGEAVHPRTFNTIKRILEEDGTVLDEEEAFAELASPEALQQELSQFLEGDGKEKIAELPDGIHSGLKHPRGRGVFFYFQARTGQSTGVEEPSTGRSIQGEVQHFWRFVDTREQRVEDNRLLIADLIRCQPDTPREIGDYDVFELQEKAIEDVHTATRDLIADNVGPAGGTVSALPAEGVPCLAYSLSKGASLKGATGFLGGAVTSTAFNILGGRMLGQSAAMISSFATRCPGATNGLAICIQKSKCESEEKGPCSACDVISCRVPINVESRPFDPKITVSHEGDVVKLNGGVEPF